MKRWKSHLYAAKRNPKTLLLKALAKSLNENIAQFVMTELQSFDTEDEAFACEKLWIEMFSLNRAKHKNGKGLNLTDGGEGASGSVPSFETKNKISQSLMGHPVSSDTRRKLREAQLGTTRKFADEHLKNLRKNVHNRRLDEQMRQAILKDFSLGLTRKQLSKKYNFCYKSICRALS